MKIPSPRMRIRGQVAPVARGRIRVFGEAENGVLVAWQRRLIVHTLRGVWAENFGDPISQSPYATSHG